MITTGTQTTNENMSTTRDELNYYMDALLEYILYKA